MSKTTGWIRWVGVGVLLATENVAAALVAGPETLDFTFLRQSMVQLQLVERDIRDPRVLAAMRKVERHLFVPEEVRQWAYEDGPLPIGYGQTISQPYIVALMSEHLQLRGPERVLEIGTGSGYQAAVLAELAREVYTIEIIPELARQAKRTLGELGYSRVHAREGDGYQGWPEAAPFDAIIVTCAPEAVPQPLIRQLKEGGRLVIPVGSWPVQKLYVVEKAGGRLIQRSVADVRFVPMQ